MANFKKSIRSITSHGSELLESISWLHYHCIDMRSYDLCSDIDEIISLQASPLGWGYLPTMEPLQITSVS